jgi:hypothetical protein
MKYSGMPAGMWMYYKGAFRKALVKDLGYTPAAADMRRGSIHAASVHS